MSFYFYGVQSKCYWLLDLLSKLPMSRKHSKRHVGRVKWHILREEYIKQGCRQCCKEAHLLFAFILYTDASSSPPKPISIVSPGRIWFLLNHRTATGSQSPVISLHNASMHSFFLTIQAGTLAAHVGRHVKRCQRRPCRALGLQCSQPAPYDTWRWSWQRSKWTF